MPRKNPYASAGADTFDPGVINLSSGLVTAIETAEGNPKVQFDSTGLWAKDASGAYVFQLDAAAGTGFFRGGIDITAGSSSAAPSTDRVRWIRTSNGTVAADILGYDSAGSGQANLTAYGDPQAVAQIVTQNPDLNTAYVSAISRTGNTGGSSVVLAAGGPQRHLIDSAGTSDFLYGGLLATSLPSSPRDGQVALLRVPANNSVTQDVVWAFVYDASITDAYKWRFIGGAPSIAVDISNFATSSLSFIAINPTLSIPRAGLYVVQVHGQMDANGEASFNGCGFTASDPYGVYCGAAMQAGGIMEPITFTTGNLQYAFRSVSGANISSFRRRLAVTPVRVS